LTPLPTLVSSGHQVTRLWCMNLVFLISNLKNSNSRPHLPCACRNQIFLFIFYSKKRRNYVFTSYLFNRHGW
jgi:hypothetical protein